MSAARASLLALALAGLVVLTAGCGSDGPSSAPSDCTRADDGKPTLVARNLQWNTDCLRVPAGEVTFTVQLEDEGVKHDLEVYGTGIERTKTELEAGPATQTLDVDLPSAGGTFSYVCTIHAQMEGDLFVDAAPSG
jgi:plastocyanin